MFSLCGLILRFFSKDILMCVDSSVTFDCIKNFLRLSFSYDILVLADSSITLVFFKGCFGVG